MASAPSSYRELPGARLLYTDHQGSWRSGVHAHDVPLVTMLLEGRMEDRHEKSQPRIVQSGGFSFTPVDMCHEHVQRSDRVRCVCVAFDQPLQRVADDLGGTFDRPLFDHRPEAGRIAARLSEEIQSTDRASVLVIQGLLIELVGEFARIPAEERSMPPWLSRAAELLRERDGDRLTVQQIADTVAVHPSHLIRSFRAHFGTTPGDFARRARLERCRHDVRAAALPLGVIAERAGFADSAHFSREFRRAFGVSPSAYRRGS